MRPFFAALALLALLAISARSLAAQEPQPNQRVRLVLVRNAAVEGYGRAQELRGTLLAIDHRSLTMQVSPGTTPMRVDRAVIRRAYVSRGLPSRASGAAVGAVMGAVVFGLGLRDCRWEDCARDGSHPSAGAAVLGAGVGAAAGALLRSERWHRVRLSPPAADPSSDAAAETALALAFVR
jgi:hypothetical protein